MGTVLLVILILLLVGALPTWPYSSGWGTIRAVVSDSCWSFSSSCFCLDASNTTWIQGGTDRELGSD